MTVTCKDCKGIIEISEKLDQQYGIVDHVDGHKEYVCWSCCQEFAAINDAKGG